MGTPIIDLSLYNKVPKFIAVEGPIGVGKTTLSTQLAESFGYEVILEEPSQNPFLDDFYKNPQQAALGTQLFFLFQRVKHVQDFKQEDIFSSSKVSDFLLDKDMLFAKVTLSERELELYMQIYNYLSLDLPTPDLVVYLQANTETLFKRIINRGIEMEKNISFEYLESLNECYKDFFLSFERSPVLIVNTESIDLANNISDFQLLVERLLQYFNNPEGRKIYFNPSPSLL